MIVKPNHPMAELLACKLFAIETVPHEEQRKMVQRAIKAACKMYDDTAAPDLYEALLKLMDEAEYYIKIGQSDAVFDKAAKALAKARGEVE